MKMEQFIAGFQIWMDKLAEISMDENLKRQLIAWRSETRLTSEHICGLRFREICVQKLSLIPYKALSETIINQNLL